MGTSCYETTYDATAECLTTGQPSGWFEGPCPLARASGGCIVGCSVWYAYPLGGLEPTLATTAATRDLCGNLDGLFIDTTRGGL